MSCDVYAIADSCEPIDLNAALRFLCPFAFAATAGGSGANGGGDHGQARPPIGPLIETHLWFLEAPRFDIGDAAAAVRHRDPKAAGDLSAAAMTATEAAFAREVGFSHVWSCRTNVGLCVDDVWLLTWMANTLSDGPALSKASLTAHGRSGGQFTEVAVFLADEDGDFFVCELNEGALPPWGCPEAMQNRTCIVGGRYLLLPPEVPRTHISDDAIAFAEPLWKTCRMQGLNCDVEGGGVCGPLCRRDALRFVTALLHGPSSTASLRHEILEAVVCPALAVVIDQKIQDAIQRARRPHRAAAVVPYDVARLLATAASSTGKLKALPHHALVSFRLSHDLPAVMRGRRPRFNPSSNPRRVVVAIAQVAAAMAHFSELPAFVRLPPGLPAKSAARREFELGAKLTIGLEALWHADTDGWRDRLDGMLGESVAGGSASLCAAPALPNEAAADFVSDDTAWIDDMAADAAKEQRSFDDFCAQWTKDLAKAHEDEMNAMDDDLRDRSSRTGFATGEHTFDVTRESEEEKMLREAAEELLAAMDPTDCDTANTTGSGGGADEQIDMTDEQERYLRDLLGSV